MNADRLLTHYEKIAEAADAVPSLRRFILDLAVHGKLVEQDPDDESASEFLAHARCSLEKRSRSGSRMRWKETEPVSSDEIGRDIPPGWVPARINDTGLYINGLAFKPTDWKQSGLPIIRIQNLTDPSKEFNCAKGDFPDEVLVRDGDLLVSWSATLEAFRWNRGEGVLNQHIFRVIPDDDLTTRDFLLLLLRNAIREMAESDHAHGLVMSHINRRPFLNHVVLIPPVTEQHRTVAKVDELMTLCDRLETARAAREKTCDRLAAASLARLNAPDPDPAVFQNHAAFALDNLIPLTTRPGQIKDLRQTILNLAVRGKLVEQDPNDEPTGEALKRIGSEREELVQRKIIRREKPLAKIGANEPPFEIPPEWQWKRIGEVALFTQYGTSTKSIHSEQGIPVLTMGNIQDGAVVWGNEKKIPTTSEELPALFLEKFDLLYNRTNSAELVGKTGIYLGEDDCKTFASYLIRMQLSQTSSSPRYMNLAMNAPVFRETQIVPLIKKQTGQANVNGTALKNMLVPLPPLAEQHLIVARVDELMALCDQLEASLATGDDTRRRLLDALLHEALSPSKEEIRQDISTITPELPDETPGSPKVLTEPALAGDVT